MITKPTLILDEDKCKLNIANMFARAQQHQTELRPHFKTHQSLEIGHWFKDVGVTKITVSSLDMAAYFAADWNDITVAFPVNILEIDTINDLASKITLNLLVESIDSLLKTIKSNDNLNFIGFLGHAGHAYKCRSKGDIIRTHSEAKKKLISLKNEYKKLYPSIDQIDSLRRVGQ